jgi:hypothetical protein
MKPTWDSLATEYASSPKVLIADVDCTAAGEPLCSRFGIEGFPTIKVFNPPDEQGEDYEGGREFDDLKAFAEQMGPGCSPATKENCSAEQLAELEEVLTIPEERRKEELATLEKDIADKEKVHEALLESLQAQYEASNKALEDAKKAAKPRIKLLKSAGTPAAAKEESKEEL